MTRFLSVFLFAVLIITTQSASARPYWNPQKVPKDSSYAAAPFKARDSAQLKSVHDEAAIDVLRVQVDWHADETYTVSHTMVEASGTPALLARATHKPTLGSYLGVLKDTQSGQTLYYDSVGTGKEYRKLTRAMSFRFPVPTHDMTFEMYSEHPQTGQIEKVISQLITANTLPRQSVVQGEVEVKELAIAAKSPSLRVNIYAEGYSADEKQEFWTAAQKAVHALQREKFPGIEYLSFYGVFHASSKRLGNPGDLGQPVPEFNSFLGLYYPYWNKFGRWYDVVYPTREDKLRHGLAVSPYDYPIVLIKNSGYWGVGNYLAYTAIPAENSAYFTYLLMHEFGHFFGLNEEYEGGGPTELEFAPGIKEPWSQNITFLRDIKFENLKWNKWVDANRKLPTPGSDWHTTPPVYGAYEGGYGDSTVTKGSSHKPGFNCTMEAARSFCDVCSDAIKQVMRDSLASPA